MPCCYMCVLILLYISTLLHAAHTCGCVASSLQYDYEDTCIVILLYLCAHPFCISASWRTARARTHTHTHLRRCGLLVAIPHVILERVVEENTVLSYEDTCMVRSMRTCI